MSKIIGLSSNYNNNLGTFGNGLGNSYNPSYNAYNGGTTKTVKITSGKKSSAPDGKQNFGSQLVGNLGGIASGFGNLFAGLNAHKAAPPVVNNYTKSTNSGNKDTLLYVGIALVVVVIGFFAFRANKG